MADRADREMIDILQCGERGDLTDNFGTTPLPDTLPSSLIGFFEKRLHIPRIFAYFTLKLCILIVFLNNLIFIIKCKK